MQLAQVEVVDKDVGDVCYGNYLEPEGEVVELGRVRRESVHQLLEVPHDCRTQTENEKDRSRGPFKDAPLKEEPATDNVFIFFSDRRNQFSLDF